MYLASIKTSVSLITKSVTLLAIKKITRKMVAFYEGSALEEGNVDREIRVSITFLDDYYKIF